MHKRVLVEFAVIFAIAVTIGTVGCGGTAGGGKDFAGTQFVATNAGSIKISVPSTITTSRTDGFRVTALDANGSPVPQIQISCDTELGLALIEPATGVEITDNFGTISGVVGCERPGSFQIGCRLPVGANKRVFASIVCTGDIPDAFTGFPGAGGGSLGGGVQISDDAGPGGTDTDGFGITGFSVNDGLEEGVFVVDTTQVNTCGDDGTDTEPFGNALFSVDFLNETNSAIDVNTYTMTVPGVGTFGPIALGASVDGGVAPNGGEQKGVTGLIAVAQSDGTKTYAGSTTAISASTGPKNVSFTFNGSNDQGDSITLVRTVGITFSNVNRCAEGGSTGGNTGDVSVSSLSFADNGTSSENADVTATTCGGSETETIGDLTFTMTINNQSGSAVNISSYTITISDLSATDTVNKTEQLSAGSDTFSGFVALGTGSAKTTIGGTSIGAIGVTSITITLTGTDGNGGAVSIQANGSVNFTEVDNCA